MNFLVALLALVPTMLEGVFFLSRLSAKLLGDAAMIPGLIASLLLGGIGEIPYVACFPILLACLFGQRLLQDPEIPARVKKTTFRLVVGVLVIMLANVSILYLQYRHGRFKGLFI